MFGTESGNNVAPVVVVFTPLPVRFAEPREQENSGICFFFPKCVFFLSEFTISRVTKGG